MKFCVEALHEVEDHFGGSSSSSLLCSKGLEAAVHMNKSGQECREKDSRSA